MSSALAIAVIAGFGAVLSTLTRLLMALYTARNNARSWHDLNPTPLSSGQTP